MENTNKKFDLMLMRRATVCSSSCLQVILVYLNPFCCNSLLAAKNQEKVTKKSLENPFLGFKVIDVLKV